MEIGLVNSIEKQKGVSIGIFNTSEELHGMQIGLWNVAKNNKVFKCMPFINFNFRKKQKQSNVAVEENAVVAE